MTHIGYLLADNSRLSRWAFDQQVRAAGVTGPQARLLLTLHRVPGENQGYYAERLEVEPITLCRMVDRLEDSGFIERRCDPADRRARQLHLTTKGSGIVEDLQRDVDALVEDMLDGFTDAQRNELRNLLEAVAANLSQRREAHRQTARSANG